MCGCLGNMHTCIFCFVLYVLCSFNWFLYIYLLFFVLIVLTYVLLPTSDNWMAVSNNNNNINNNKYYYSVQFNNYIIFFLQLLLSFQSSSINPFSPNCPLIPSSRVSLGLPHFVLPGGRQFMTSFGNLPSSILWTCQYHWSCLVLISSKGDLVTFILCLVTVFLILSFLEIRAERRQKSISVEFSFATVFAFKHKVSAAYVIVLLTITC
jgi:hypothetical protein